MADLVTAARMRAIEAAAIAAGRVTGLELMERAGAGVVAAVLDVWPAMARSPQRAVVLCGPGNNGGDGFVVARLLKARGWDVRVFLHGDPDRMPPDARVNHDRWRDVAGVVAGVTAATPEAVAAALAEGSGRRGGGAGLLCVDALFGTGLARPLRDDPDRLAGLIADAAAAGRAHVVAVDVPSGLCADSGRLLCDRAAAALTVTFHALKPGHVLAEGPAACGRTVRVDIGLDPAAAKGPGPVLTARPQGIGKAAGHKFSHGHALILSGPATRSGAARLAARGALRIGAGLVTVGAPQDALPECAAHLTAIMLREVGQGADLGGVLADRRINALCLGPGLGLDDRAAGLLAAALGKSSPPSPLPQGEGGAGGAAMPDADLAAPRQPPAPPSPSRRGAGGEARPTVLDADALTHLARCPTLLAALHETCILTPHAGEFARLFPDIAEKLDAPAISGPAYSKVDATREAAARAGCVVLFKGPDTVIADPAGRVAINAAIHDRAAPWLATAGSGDVLAGFITGLLARGFAPFDAACTAAWLHVACALAFGPGLIAEDLPDTLPAVLQRLGQDGA